MADLTLMIQTCSKFSDLWDAHIHLLNQNWPDRPRTLLVTDAPTAVHFPGVEMISAGAGLHMPQRLAAALPQIQTEYILLTLDDYFPIQPISSGKIARLVQIMETEGLDYIRLFPDPPAFRRMKNGLYQIDLSVDYAVNLYPGIWRRDFLAKTILDTNIWTYEVSLTHTARRENARCAMSKGQEFPILDVVRKGKLLHRAAWYLRKHPLYHGGREIISWQEELRIFLFSTGKKLLPRPAARWVKQQLRSRGYRFYSDEVTAYE